ncbi:MAG: hypothetical protein WCL38_06880 [Actinomycetota bacterium]
MRGKWAAGIAPKHFTWIFKDSLAVSERPGGFTANHRRVRRQEEIIWLESQHFTKIVSLLGTPHNLAAYDEHKLASSSFDIPLIGDPHEALLACFKELNRSLDAGAKILLHHDELSDVTLGVVAGFLVWSHKATSGPQAIAITERLTTRPLGPVARTLVAASIDLEPAPSA